MRQFYKKTLSMLIIFFMIFQCIPSAFASIADGPLSTGDGNYAAVTPSITSAVYGDQTEQLGFAMSATAPWEGEGTTDDPYVVTSASELDEVRHYGNEHFVLGADINLDVHPYNAGEGWEPMIWFDGTFDGNGYEISGLYINRPGEDEVGLFGLVGLNGEISNLKLENVDVTGSYFVGGLAGMNSGSISQITVSGKVTGVEDYYESEAVGGLVGDNKGHISDSQSSSEVTGQYSVGGLIGDNNGSVKDSYTSGHVVGIGVVGGLVGWNFSSASISDSLASGKVSGSDMVGGLVGRNAGGISNSYASGEVEGGSDVGGLAGSNIQVINNSYASGKVTGQSSVGGLVGSMSGGKIDNSYAYGEVSGYSLTGGLIGSGTGDVTNSYWDIQATGQEQSAAGEGMTTEQLQQRNSFDEAWDFLGIWEIDASGGYPFLKWELNIAITPPWNGEGSGSENNPYLITSAEQLNEVRNYPNAHFELGGEIDLSLAYGAGDGWEPIGTTSSPFIGTLDGNGHKITGLYINRIQQDEVGLFGVIGSGSEVANIKLENVTVHGHANVGGLAGVNDGAINNVHVNGQVTGISFVGGVIGANAGNMNQSHASSTVAGIDFLGGLAGVNEGNISNSYAHGDVIDANQYAGGLVGVNFAGTISNSYASGKVTGNEYTGGLVSENMSGHIIASYWDKEISNQTTSGGSSEEFGKTTVEMRQLATFADWDFDNIWAIDEGESYPYLKWDNEGAGLPWTGSGTEEDPYVIKTAAHFNQIRDHLSAYFRLGADINLDVMPFNTGEGWVPIKDFNGNLDGKGYTITGLYINRSIEEVVGLFGYTGAASKISNVKLEGVSVTVTDNDLVGGLVGYNNGSISYSSVNGRVEGRSNAGSLVGYNNGSISYSSASGEVTGNDFLGGLAGANAGSITQSFAKSKVNGVDFLGGLLGVNDGNVSNSYAQGDVIAVEHYTGGLVGTNYGGTISNSYASGKVIGEGFYVGGLVSENIRSGRISNSYWDKVTSGRAVSAGSDSSYGKSTAEMMQQATYEGWDFDSIWEIEENERYPYLKWEVNADLSGLTLSEGIISPAFTAETINYTARVKSSVSSVIITATAATGTASLEVNGTRVISGVATAFPLHVGRNTIDVTVTAPDGTNTKMYTIEITRPSDDSSEPDIIIINVPVETGSIGSATTVMQTPITRITEPSGRVRDEVMLTAFRARETAQRIAEAGQSTARIMIPDEEDRVSQVDVSILRDLNP